MQIGSDSAPTAPPRSWRPPARASSASFSLPAPEGRLGVFAWALRGS